MSSKVSVIVPIYNVEKYLNRCIESILGQTYKNLEVILIDDGSTDSSGKMCDAWKEKDSRIMVIHKTNAGLGFARNSGMEIMTGEYCVFVDSDDFIETNMIEIMMNSLVESNAKVCYSSFDFYSNELKKATAHGNVNVGEFSGKEVLLDIVGSEPGSKKDYNKEMSVWAALFSTSIISNNKIEFPSEREVICEDLPFDIKYLPLIDKVVIIDDELYHYCYNNTSLTHKYNKDRYDKELFLYKYLYQKLKKVYDINEYELRLKRLFLGRIRASMNVEIKNSNQNISRIISDLRRISSNDLIQEVLNEYPYQLNPIKIRIFNYFMHKKMPYMLYLLCKLR